MAYNLDTLLNEFQSTDMAVRFSSTVTNILPFAESIPHCNSIEQAAMAASPQNAAAGCSAFPDGGDPRTDDAAAFLR